MRTGKTDVIADDLKPHFIIAVLVSEDSAEQTHQRFRAL